MFFISCLSDIICKGGTGHETEEKDWMDWQLVFVS